MIGREGNRIGEKCENARVGGVMKVIGVRGGGARNERRGR